MLDSGPVNNASARPARQAVTFYVGEYLFGIDVLRVQEVLRPQKMTAVPLAPPVIEGLINLRGQIVPALDMRQRLQIDPRSAEVIPMNVIVRSLDGPVCLIVDEIGDVVVLDQENIERLPDNLASAAAGVIHAVYKLKDSLLLLLDTDNAIDVDSTPH